MPQDDATTKIEYQQHDDSGNLVFKFAVARVRLMGKNPGIGKQVRVFFSDASPAWRESRFGKLWDQGVEGIEQYNRINKQESLERALRDMGAETWFAGLRRVQAETRARIDPIEFKRGRYKVQPLFDWTDLDVRQYLKKHQLPYHPMWEKGYLSTGDWHTTRSLAEVDSMEDLRFFGLKRESGLHEG